MSEKKSEVVVVEEKSKFIGIPLYKKLFKVKDSSEEEVINTLLGIFRDDSRFEIIHLNN
jgi:hypothetical protein